jgi:sugar (pentulose or hexulose) kinase
LLAAVGVGMFESVPDAARRVVSETSVTKPSDAVGAYAPCYERYRALYPALAGEFRSLAGE